MFAQALRALPLAMVIIAACLGPSEAAREGQKVWDDFFIKCGGTYYYAQGPKQVLGVRISGSVIEEFRGIDVQTEPLPLTQADSLNDVQWKGYSRFVVKSSRMYEGGWQDWLARDYVYAVQLEKRSGKWTSEQPTAMGFFPMQPSARVACSEIPK